MVLVAAGWLMPFAAAIAGHPALRGDGETACVARDVARGTRGGTALAKGVVSLDRGALPAALALIASIGYLALWTMRRASTPVEQIRPAHGPATLVLLGSSLVAHAAAATFARTGGDLVAVALIASLTTAAGATVAALAPSGIAPPALPTPSPLRLAALLASGILLSIAAFPLDLVLGAISGWPQFPEAWLPIAVHAGVSGSVAYPLCLGGALTAAVLAIEVARSRIGDTSFTAFLILAPASILVLGPMSPFKGAAVAFTAHVLFRSGTNVFIRTAAILAPSGALVALTVLG
jgi:hypothetical protein